MSKILVVEDNEDIRDLLLAFLKRKQHGAIAALDGEQAVRLARAEQPDVILMDMSLPVLDGWEATRRIKAAAETRHIPVIALTAHAFRDEVAKSAAAGCDDFESKPIDFARLLEKIESYLPPGAPPAA